MSDGAGGSSWRDPVKLVGVVSVVIGAVIGGIQIKDRLFPEHPPKVSIVYVLDTSHAMAGRMGHVSKLAAAKAKILAQVEDQPGYEAEIQFAGASRCDGDVRRRVGFRTSGRDDFASALSDVHASGRSDFARSVRRAVNDLVTRDPSTSKALVVMVAGADHCTPRPIDTVTEALDFLRDRKALVNFQFIGVRAPRQVRRMLARAKRAATEAGFPARVSFARKPSDLAVAPVPETGREDQYP